MDKRRLHREVLKQAFFNAPCATELTQTITVEGTMVTTLSDGPDGYCHHATHQDNPLEYAKNKLKEDKYKQYKLIVK